MPLFMPPLSSFHSICPLRLPFFPSDHRARPLRRGDLTIRMGGGPRTYPGGVSKWQWKRMQAKKAKQLLKARLARERQLYEMRKRAELRAAVAQLERPWEPAPSAPNLLSVAADDQLKALADRFHRPGGLDLWNERDGPQVFASPATGRASARFFPKNAVHSVQPYALLAAGSVRENAAEEVKDVERTQCVRENAREDETDGDDESAVECRERDGTWEPANDLDEGYDGDDEDDDAASEWGWNSDGLVSDSDDMGDGALSRGNRREGGMARRGAASALAAGDDDERDWNGEGAREGSLGSKWQESRENGRKNNAGRWKPSNASSNDTDRRDRIGGVSFSDVDANHGGFVPKWRARDREETRSGMGRRKPSNASNGNPHGRHLVDDEFNTNSDNRRDGGFEPKWKARNRVNWGENGRRGSRRPKVSVNADNGGVRRFMRGNNANGDGFASDLEAPIWKPSKKVREVRKNAARREDGDGKVGRFSGGRAWGSDGSGAGRWRPTNSMNTSREEDGSLDSRYRTQRKGGPRFEGDGYSLRPTSDLYSSWKRRD